MVSTHNEVKQRSKTHKDGCREREMNFFYLIIDINKDQDMNEYGPSWSQNVKRKEESEST